MELTMKTIVFSVLIIIFTCSYAQYYETPQQSGIGIPFFDIEIFKTFAEDAKNSRVYIYSKILYDDLTFIKNDTANNYLAEFEMVAAVFNDKGLQINSKINKKKIIEEDYEVTNSREETIQIAESFDLPPDEYELKLQINDLVSNKSTNRKIDLDMENFFEEDISISDLLFLEEIALDSIGSLIDKTPKVSRNFTNKKEDSYLQFDLYCKNVPSTVSIKYILENEKGKNEFDTTIVKEISSQISSQYFRFNQKILLKNRYHCIVKVESDGTDAQRSKWISFFWITIPGSADDINLALQQMRYILPGDSLDKYEDADFTEQQKFFKRYWADRDPNPNSPVNELMREYFSRVNLANREYSSFSTDGWLSDRGRILIKFGYPDDVERHPFELNSRPYEIWRYYTLRKVFVFVDRTGFGDYRLLPEYMQYEY
jgi:GWxTD domain-containing protein